MLRKIKYPLCAFLSVILLFLLVVGYGFYKIEHIYDKGENTYLFTRKSQIEELVTAYNKEMEEIIQILCSDEKNATIYELSEVNENAVVSLIREKQGLWEVLTQKFNMEFIFANPEKDYFEFFQTYSHDFMYKEKRVDSSKCVILKLVCRIDNDNLIWEVRKVKESNLNKQSTGMVKLYNFIYN